jgi:hypothetical protein
LYFDCLVGAVKTNAMIMMIITIFPRIALFLPQLMTVK